jgi:hypothetical protein
MILASVYNPKSLFTILSIGEQFTLLKPMIHETKEWEKTITNLVRTGIWSGGFVDLDTAKQCYSGQDMERMMERLGFEMVDELPFYKIPAFMDMDALRRGPISKSLARKFGWDYVGLYKKL